MPRKPRILQVEYPYHVTIRTNNRSFRFERRKTIRLFAQVLHQASLKYGVKVHHFVLMSNHIHAILWATEPNLHRFMQYVNSLVARRFNQIAQRTGHLWGDRYRACIIDTDDYYFACVRYIYRNPLRAGMVNALQDFEDSTFPFYAFGKPVGLFLQDDHLVVRYGEDQESLRRFFRELVEDQHDGLPDPQVKKGLTRPFFGSSGFVQRMNEQYLH